MCFSKNDTPGVRSFLFVTSLTTGPVATYKTSHPSYCQSPNRPENEARSWVIDFWAQTLPREYYPDWNRLGLLLFFVSNKKNWECFFQKLQSTLMGTDTGFDTTTMAGFLIPNHRCPCVAARIRLMSTADLKKPSGNVWQKKTHPSCLKN